MHTKYKFIHEVTCRCLEDRRSLSCPSPSISPSLESRLAAEAGAPAAPALCLCSTTAGSYSLHTRSSPRCPGPAAPARPSSPTPHLPRAGALGAPGQLRRPQPPQAGAADGEGHPRPSGPPPAAPPDPAAARPGPSYLGGPGGAAPPAAARSRAQCRSCRPARPPPPSARPPPPSARPRRRAGPASATASRRGLAGARRVQALTASSRRGSHRLGPGPPRAPLQGRPLPGGRGPWWDGPGRRGPWRPRSRAGAQPAEGPGSRAVPGASEAGLSEGCFMAPPP